MRQLFVLACAALASLALSGCQLESTEQLLDPSEAKLAFGDRFAALGVEKDDRILDERGEVGLVTATAKGNGYEVRMSGLPDDQRLIARFYPTRNLPFDFILEMVGPESVLYSAARKRGEFLLVEPISLSRDVLAKLKQRGIQPESKGSGHLVRSRGALDETVRAWAEEARAKPEAETFPMRFQIATGEPAMSALTMRAITASCLARAGHPFDPSVRELPGKFAFGVPIDRIEAAAAKKSCAAGSDPAAPDSVRYALARGHFQAQEYNKAVEIADGLIAKDFGLAYLLRADQLMRGLGTAVDKVAAQRMLEAAAPRHPVVAHTLGLYFESGQFGQVDAASARRLFEQAEAAGFAAAKVALARAYARGNGVPKDEARAFRLFKDAADANIAQGHLELGKAYYTAWNTNEDRVAAYRHFKLAADARLTEGEYLAGFMLAFGQGVQKSESTAVPLLARATEHGSVEAKAELGWLTYHGKGTSADEAKGRKLLTEAAQQGSATAKEYLARLDKPTLPGIPSSVPGNVQADARTLGGDGPFQLNHANMAFMAGMADRFIKDCGLPSNAADRMELTGLALNGASSLLGGPDYSNPDIGKAVGGMLGATGMLAAGRKFAEQIPCNSTVAAHMAKRLADASRSNKGSGNSPFLPSCARAFDETRCACLAQLGRGAVPDIYQRTYNRAIIQEIIARNPLLALSVAGACGIVNY